MNVTRTTPVVPASRAIAKAVVTPTEAPAPAPKAPAVKAQAQGAVKTTAKVLSGAAGAVGGGGLGAMVGWCAWFFANAGGTALSANVIGVGLLVGAAACGYLGWKNGGAWGDVIEETLGLGKK